MIRGARVFADRWRASAARLSSRMEDTGGSVWGPRLKIEQSRAERGSVGERTKGRRQRTMDHVCASVQGPRERARERAPASASASRSVRRDAESSFRSYLTKPLVGQVSGPARSGPLVIRELRGTTRYVEAIEARTLDLVDASTRDRKRGSCTVKCPGR